MTLRSYLALAVVMVAADIFNVLPHPTGPVDWDRLIILFLGLILIGFLSLYPKKDPANPVTLKKKPAMVISIIHTVFLFLCSIAHFTVPTNSEIAKLFPGIVDSRGAVFLIGTLGFISIFMFFISLISGENKAIKNK